MKGKIKMILDRKKIKIELAKKDMKIADLYTAVSTKTATKAVAEGDIAVRSAEKIASALGVNVTDILKEGQAYGIDALSKEGVVIPNALIDVFPLLPNNSFKKLFSSIRKYAEFGEIPDFENYKDLQIAWPLVKEMLDELNNFEWNMNEGEKVEW